MTKTLINANHPYTEQMSQLCESFHALRGKAGVRPWDQYLFAKVASGPAYTGATRLAAAFVLSVWNGSQIGDCWWCEEPYSVGKFDVVEAFGRWDEEMQAAFIAWCNNPFWP